MITKNTNSKQCHLCVNNAKSVDYKDVEMLKGHLDTHARIVKHRRSSTCSKHQRAVATAVKRARFLALLPYLAG